jgi:hypothetical protein
LTSDVFIKHKENFMADTTTHTGSFGATSDPTAAFSGKGEQAKTLNKLSPIPLLTTNNGIGVGNNLTKITPVAVFPEPKKQ